MLGVFFADGDQHFDHRSVRITSCANCSSDLLYKGALRDASRAVYSGWVHVRPGAQKTDAMQTSRNIVLSEHAKADAIPNLEIEANDVRCGHAASVGPVDDETVFYLESRGSRARRPSGSSSPASSKRSWTGSVWTRSGTTPSSRSRRSSPSRPPRRCGDDLGGPRVFGR